MCIVPEQLPLADNDPPADAESFLFRTRDGRLGSTEREAGVNLQGEGTLTGNAQVLNSKITTGETGFEGEFSKQGMGIDLNLGDTQDPNALSLGAHGRYDIAKAKASTGNLLLWNLTPTGVSESRRGLVLRTPSAGASGMEGEVGAQLNIPIPFTDKSWRASFKKSASTGTKEDLKGVRGAFRQLSRLAGFGGGGYMDYDERRAFAFIETPKGMIQTSFGHRTTVADEAARLEEQAAVRDLMAKLNIGTPAVVEDPIAPRPGTVFAGD